MKELPQAGEAKAAVSKTVAQIKFNDTHLHAVAEMLEDSALLEAEHCDAVSSQGVTLGPLHGLPFVVKDIIDVAGVSTRSGSLTRKDSPPCDRDAPVVAALRSAGAIPVAKSNTVEFAIGGWGTNQTVGTPHNPWDLNVPRVPGGSSSGTGALVGAGLVPAGLGTDTGGSVRLPAAFCGCVGLKTSIGLVSRTGVTPLSDTLDTVGPLTSTVELAAQMLAVMQGPDLDDPSTIGSPLKCPMRDLDRGIFGLRLGAVPTDAMPYLSEEMATAFESAINQLFDAGATIANCTLPMSFEDYQMYGGIISATEAYATYSDIVDDLSSPMAEPNRLRMARGNSITAAERIRIERDRTRSIADFEAVIDGFDAIVLPTTPYAAIPIAEVDESDMTYGNHTRFANYLELAGLSVPMSLTDAGLPTSLQIVTRRFDDPLALRIGRAFEQVRGPFQKPTLKPAGTKLPRASGFGVGN